VVQSSPSQEVNGRGSRRFLLGFGIGLGVLVIASVVLALVFASQPPPRLPEDTPEGTVQAYLTALQERDFQKAWGYLLPPADRTGWSYDTWLRQAPGGTRESSSWKATLGSVNLKGSEAVVEVGIDTFRPGGLFSDPVRSQRISFSLRQQSGAWKIINPVDVWWLY
jgi:hypothetical protein